MSVEISARSAGRQDRHTPFSVAFEQAAIRAARENARQAVSYRGFKVGALAVVQFPNLQVFLRGSNHSPYRGAPKRCAEMDILAQVDDLANSTGGQPTIAQLYVAGPGGHELTKEINGLAAPTLHPCVECRGLLAGHAATEFDTQIVTAGLNDGGIIERHDLAQMLDLYRFIQPPASSLMLGRLTLVSAAYR